MRQALAWAEVGEGGTRPNPPVGCVIVLDNDVIGHGYHEYAGGRHAEAIAIDASGEKVRGAEMYVTLEPCSTIG
ncbi:MAG: riboflavin biosynthesis protein RibD, partial [Lentisphaerae bacterium]|nr:riboflavin biosynthesis protein RibD [Lentisphaerota bacterium]